MALRILQSLSASQVIPTESFGLFFPFQYQLLSLTKEDNATMKASCACRIYEIAGNLICRPRCL